ncbi:MAG: M20/M25/M40 family metallo-hydrolase [Betaproteobacteria bacterium]|nr:MAG: M20/M25/M40 family metallo-hydrolase [Betaproteobacteria bacterium]
MKLDAAQKFVATLWDREIVPRLQEYIRIPCKSPHFDPAWETHGYIEQAVQLATDWCRQQPIPGMTCEIVRLPGRTPLLFLEIPGDAPGTVLLYGHLDKQPEMTGWREGRGPWEPVIEGDKLYGRGGADDGYAVFASLAAVMALREQGIAHARCVAMIECCEESGSYDLPAYLESLVPRVGQVDLVIGLDSGCSNYDQLWFTTSLRGIAAGTLRVDVLTEGVHSGDASGIVPSSFRIARLLLDRIEDPRTGAILPQEFHCAIPPERLEQARAVGAMLGAAVYRKYPFAGSTSAMVTDSTEAVLNRTWRPFLSVVGANGLPAIANAGNVLRPYTELKLSLRIPPLVDGAQATRDLKRILEADPPYGAKVSFEPDQGATGWNAPASAPWLLEAAHGASQSVFGKPAAMKGGGGTIPFMGMLGKNYPQAQFLITGVLGPMSNAHGPNEFLHIAYGKRLTTGVALVLEHHARRSA